MRNIKGFTLIELLIVITILGTLAVAGASNYMSSLQRSRDGRRKADLSNINKALESSYNDSGSYPAASGYAVSGLCVSDVNCYLRTTPKDPNGTDYCYVLGSTSGTNQSFGLYANLERSDDAQIGSYSVCGGTWTYGVSSTNTTPTTH